MSLYLRFLRDTRGSELLREKLIDHRLLDWIQCTGTPRSSFWYLGGARGAQPFRGRRMVFRIEVDAATAARGALADGGSLTKRWYLMELNGQALQ